MVYIIQQKCLLSTDYTQTSSQSHIDINKQPVERWKHILADFKVGQSHDFAKFSVALRELMLLSLNCQPVAAK